MTYKSALAKIQRLDAEACAKETALRAAGKTPNRCRYTYLVRVVTEEGGVFAFENAYAIWMGEWLGVASEHAGYHIHHRDEILFCDMYKRVDIQGADPHGC